MDVSRTMCSNHPSKLKLSIPPSEHIEVFQLSLPQQDKEVLRLWRAFDLCVVRKRGDDIKLDDE